MVSFTLECVRVRECVYVRKTVYICEREDMCKRLCVREKTMCESMGVSVNVCEWESVYVREWMSECERERESVWVWKRVCERVWMYDSIGESVRKSEREWMCVCVRIVCVRNKMCEYECVCVKQLTLTDWFPKQNIFTIKHNHSAFRRLKLTIHLPTCINTDRRKYARWLSRDIVTVGRDIHYWELIALEFSESFFFIIIVPKTSAIYISTGINFVWKLNFFLFHLNNS